MLRVSYSTGTIQINCAIKLNKTPSLHPSIVLYTVYFTAHTEYVLSVTVGYFIIIRVSYLVIIFQTKACMYSII